MHVLVYSHRSGKSTVGKTLLQNLLKNLEKISFNIHRNCAADLREAILSNLVIDGWSNKVQIAKQKKLTITAMHGRIGLCPLPARWAGESG